MYHYLCSYDEMLIETAKFRAKAQRYDEDDEDECSTRIQTKSCL